MQTLGWLASMVWWATWPAVVIGVLVPIVAVVRGGPPAAPAPGILVAMFLPAIALLVWSALLYGQARSGATATAITVVHLALALGGTGLTGRLAWRARGTGRAWLLVVQFAAALPVTAIAWFIGGMALSDVWL